MAEQFVRAHLRKLKIRAERLARAGLLTEQIAADLAEAKVILWVLRGDQPDA